MANLCIKAPSSASLVLIFQLLVLRPRPNVDATKLSKLSDANVNAIKLSDVPIQGCAVLQ